METKRQMIEVLENSWRLFRSGVFDVQSYTNSNPDLQSLRWPLLHFVRYGRHEDRRYRASALDRWSIQKILTGALSPREAKSLKLTAAKNDNEEVSHQIHLLGLDPLPWLFAIALEQSNSDALDELIEHMQGRDFFDAAFDVALKRLDMRYVERALKWGIAHLETASVDLSFLDKLRSLEEVTNLSGISRDEFHAKLMSAWQTTNGSMTQSELSVLGMPVSPEDKTSCAELLETLDQMGVSLSLEPSGLDETAARCVNAATLNALTGRRHVIGADGSIEAVSEIRSGKCFYLRLPSSRMWWHPQTSTFHRSVLQANQAIINVVHSAGISIFPTHAGRLHVIDRINHEGLPVISYHSTSTGAMQMLHYKESALPGLFSFDSRGFSGWSSWSQGADAAGDGGRDGNIEAFKSAFRAARVSKYAQPETAGSIPENAIFFPLQIPSDTVMSLAYIAPVEVARTLAELSEMENFTLILKAHPLDLGSYTRDWMQALVNDFPCVHISTAHIHDLVAAACAVVVANSGVGLEALMFDTPVVSFAPSEYAQATLSVRTVAELEQAVRKLLTQGASDNLAARSSAFLSRFLAQGVFDPEKPSPASVNAICTLGRSNKV